MRNISQSELDQIDAEHDGLVKKAFKVLKIILIVELVMLPVVIAVYGGEKANDEFGVVQRDR